MKRFIEAAKRYKDRKWGFESKYARMKHIRLYLSYPAEAVETL